MSRDSGTSFPDWPTGLAQALDRLAIAANHPARGQHAGAVGSRQRGRALEFADYRAYSPGDDPKLVDWRAYTRLDRLYLKQYDEERARTVTLLVDVSGSLNWGVGDAHKGLYARRLAAALAWVALGRLEPVRVCLLRESTAIWLPPVAVRPTLASLFQGLGDVREAGRTDLASAVRAALGGSRSRGPDILLTDLLDPTWREALESLARRGEGVVLQLLAPDEWDPPLGDEVELEDVETGELRPTRLGPVEQAGYHRQLRAFLAEVREYCRRHDLLYAALSTGSPLQEVLLRQLPTAGVLV